jgi:hypothetical protein
MNASHEASSHKARNSSDINGLSLPATMIENQRVHAAGRPGAAQCGAGEGTGRFGSTGQRLAAGAGAGGRARAGDHGRPRAEAFPEAAPRPPYRACGTHTDPVFSHRASGPCQVARSVWPMSGVGVRVGARTALFQPAERVGGARS